jgi:hypothetical protein
MISRRDQHENPVGPAEPGFRFPFSHWQVVVALLVVAALLSAWKAYEARFVAPHAPLDWQPFSLHSVQQATRQSRDVLVWIHPPNGDPSPQPFAAAKEPDFRAAVYQSGAMLLRVDRPGQLDREARAWLDRVAPAAASEGGLLQLHRGNRAEASFVAASALTPAEAVRLARGEP